MKFQLQCELNWKLMVIENRVRYKRENLSISKSRKAILK